MSDIEKLSTPETDTKTIDNKIQTFANTIHGEKKNLERNLEKKLGGGSGRESSKSSNKDVDDNNKMKEEKWSKMSSMEEEALRERTRATLLKQCSAYLAADGSSRYTRETFRRVFTEKVSLFKINRLKIPMMT
ncbi:hypothetical protein Phum_PHUM389370 [Pediculus humanus corporis]|uniref:Uncharacterized protein n=1 Tax=Pediculus humanus subsp. corporis TaxID=121224 RepID=E0VQY6_PEDHC|nr:uncharacterized protein Phum_PHUM389370 [Pediculus humanus corporis]EEB15792.1 hypothetical protein Phum_PHUM389370 [Pediculus humanus corporis]